MNAVRPQIGLTVPRRQRRQTGHGGLGDHLSLRRQSELTLATGWVNLIGSLFITLSSYTAGQDVVQRYISTPTARQAARAIWTNAIMVIPSTMLFFAVGTALYAYYKLNPGNLDPTLQNDAVFP